MNLEELKKEAKGRWKDTFYPHSDSETAEIYNFLDTLTDKIFAAGKEAGRNETPASMRLHEKDCCKLWAGCDCVSCDCGKEARELRMARSNTSS